MTTEKGEATRHPAIDVSRADAASATFWDQYFSASSSVRQPLSLPYVPALDGIRALAVLAVLLYHAGYAWIPGGFLGVEVFFVLSGYLITSLLLAEWRSSGRVDLKNFWIRRARRLLPALYLLLIGTLTYAVVMLPDQVARLRSDAVAAFFYVTNWWQIFDHQSYFEAVGRPSLLMHLWSLAVEEQFYLIWPPVFALCIARFKRRHLLIGVIVGALASTSLMAILYDPAVDPSRLYYGTDTRAAELLVGAALAFLWQPEQTVQLSGRIGSRVSEWLSQGRRLALLSEAAGLIALIGLGLALWRFGEFNPRLYQGGFLLVALATAGLIAVVVSARSRWITGFLGSPPLRWVGLRSYGIYLWHWPVYMATRPGVDVPLHGVSLLGLRILITIGLVELSYRGIEAPFRSGRVGRAWRSFRPGTEGQPRLARAMWLGVSGIMATSTLVLGIFVARAKPAVPPAYLAVQEVHIAATPRPARTPLPVVAAATPASPPPSSVQVNDVPTPQTPSNLGTAPTPSPTPMPTPTPAPTATPTPLPPPSVTAVGDSVMVGAASEMANDIPNLDVDAKIGMQVSEAVQILQAKLAAGTLHDVVVVDIGNNGPLTPDEFDQIMQIAGKKRRVIFLSVRVPRAWEGTNNQVLAEGVARYSNASLIDWYGETVDHPELFWDDGIHLRPAGARLYAMLIAAQISPPG